MKKFFIPDEFLDGRTPEEVYEDLKQLNGITETPGKKVYSIVVEHGGGRYLETVGKISKESNDMVIAIIYNGHWYYTITPSHGFFNSGRRPMMASVEDRDVDYFAE